MPELLQQQPAVDVADQDDVDTVLEHAESLDGRRHETGAAARTVLETSVTEAIRQCVPDGCHLHVAGTDGGLSATIVIPDRAPVKSLHGATTLTLRWNAGEDSVTLAGKQVPLSELAARLQAYDRTVNWSAVQGLSA